MLNDKITPLVSVIIPTYSGSECISRAVKSVEEQTYTNIEIIVVDDNVPDSEERTRTRNRVEKLKQQYSNIQYIEHTENKNGAAARNTGLSVSKGKYIAFLDDDDYYFPQKVEKCVSILEKEKEYDAVFTGVLITENRYVLNVVQVHCQQNPDVQIMFDVNMIGTGSNLFLRQKAVADINGFDEAFTRHQDVEFLVRFFEKHKVVATNEILVVKTRMGANNSPSYQKFSSIKTQFNQKFQYKIDLFSEEQKKQYYMRQKATLLHCCFGNESRANIKKAKNELQIYRPLSIGEKLNILLCLVGTSKCNLYVIIKKMLMPIKKRMMDARIRKKQNVRFVDNHFVSD